MQERRRLDRYKYSKPVLDLLAFLKQGVKGQARAIEYSADLFE